MKLNNRSKLQRQLFLIAITSIGVFIAFRYFLPLIFPFIFAYLIMRLILPIVRFLKEKLHCPVILGSIISLLVTVGALGSGIFYVLCVVLEQLRGFLRNIPIYTQIVVTNLDLICCKCDCLLGFTDGTAYNYLFDHMSSVWGLVKQVTLPVISTHTLSIFWGIIGFISILFIIIIAVINMILDYDSIRSSYLQSELYQTISPVTSKLAKVGVAYIKTQLIIMFINSVILVSGFYFIGSPYAWLAGIGIAIMDAFPVVGSGLFLIPIAAIKLVGGRYFAAATLILLYGVCEFIRSLIEPRLLGDRIGLKPIFTLMSMYVGVQLFGVIGFLLGPLALVIIKTIVEETQNAGKEEKGQAEESEQQK
ncbi:MAG: AI-2E family transporter [bacterium]|nr:AI-2E family transporter [bacterium]